VIETTNTTVNVRRVINAAREDVFRAWTSPEFARKWSWGSEYETIAVSIDARVGGEWTQHIRNRDTGENWFFDGVFQESDPPKRLVHSFHFKSDRGEDEPPSIVTIEFQDRGSKTEVVINHIQLPPDKIAGTETGWIDVIACVEKSIIT